MDYYTTYEESVKLIEAGIKPETSDLSYQNICYKGISYSNNFEPTITPYTKALESLNKLKEEYKKNIIEDKGVDAFCAWEVKPCWSLGALMNLFPCGIDKPVFTLTRGGLNGKTDKHTNDWFALYENEGDDKPYFWIQKRDKKAVKAIVKLILELKKRGFKL